MILKRWWQRIDVTYGALIDYMGPICLILEPPWEDNKPDLSCIPAGLYECVRVKSELIKRIFEGTRDETFEIRGVPDRELIRFHPGNTVKDTKGCPIVAKCLGKYDAVADLERSKIAFMELMETLKNLDKFTLHVE